MYRKAANDLTSRPLTWTFVSHRCRTVVSVKRCKKCGEVKTRSAFYANKGCADGLRPDCKLCNLAAKKARYYADPKREIARVKEWQQANRERLNAYRRQYRKGRKAIDREQHLRRKFGITQADYEAMLAAQSGGCAICGDRPPEGVSLHVDHDHDTGVVRGLLCIRCNNALGALRESDEVVLRAAAYLGRDAELDGLARQRARALATLSS